MGSLCWILFIITLCLVVSNLVVSIIILDRIFANMVRWGGIKFKLETLEDQLETLKDMLKKIKCNNVQATCNEQIAKSTDMKESRHSAIEV